MNQAIENLRKHIKESASLLEKMPNNEELKQEIYAMVSAVNVLEIYEHGHHITKYNEIIGGIEK